MSTRPKIRAPHFQMWDYISAGASVIAENFNIDMSRQSITGHSMGWGVDAGPPSLWHYASVSAFAQFVIPHSRIGAKAAGLSGEIKQHGKTRCDPPDA